MTPQQAYENRSSRPWSAASQGVQNLWLAAWTIAWAIAEEAEREACAKVCDERAMRCEYEAQHELDFGGTEADVAGLRSTAWLLHVSAAEIRARSTA